MRAIVQNKYGDAHIAFSIQEVPQPKIKSDEVLIEVMYSGVNFADVLARVGLYDEAPKLPGVILGYDVSGVVKEIGSKVTKFKVGDRVAALTRFGGYGSFVAAKEFGTAIVPEGFDMALAPALATQACTAYYCAMECVTLHEGDKVLVQAAAGGVGSVLVQIAKDKGCEVFATASTSKHEFVKSLGADHVIDYNSQSFEKVIKEISPDGIDVVFDSLGGQAFKKAFKLLKPTGKMVCFGAAENISAKKNKLNLIPLVTGFGIFSPIALLMQSRSIITVNMLKIADYKPNLFADLFKNTIEMTKIGVINPHLGKVFEVEKFAEAHEFVESRKSIGKVVLKW
jgi:NADPH:quinone reductase-like Zn-dependent oxidoreductase